ncbi:MAG: hydrogenase subunit MbhD domain-containing protein [Desulfonatronovibrionaceae bacterium]
MSPVFFLDVLLIVALLLTAWRLLESSDLFQAIVLFVSFGLFLALVWLRLMAPDIALAEAAVGAGLSGVLLLGTFKGLEPDFRKKDKEAQPCRLDRPGACPTRVHQLTALLGVLGLAGLLAAAVFELPRSGRGLTELAAAAFDSGGIDHLVTAVLLDFRLYDTWLELAVLVLALLGVRGAGGRHSLRGLEPPSSPSPVLLWLVRLLIPVVFTTAVYLLLLGDHAPGGAFQAGVILASGLTLLWLAGYRSVAALPRWGWYALVICGFGAVEALAVFASWDADTHVLGYPPGLTKPVLMALESLATLSIGVILATLTIETLGGRQREPDGAEKGGRR